MLRKPRKDAGIKRGPRGPNGTQSGSVPNQISHMEVGDVFWVETTAENHAATQRLWNVPKSRRPEVAKDFILQTSAWNAASASCVGEFTVLVKVERIK